MSQTPILENPAQATNLGGYRLTKYREAGGRETTCFSAELTLNGATIATVRNDGNGGSNFHWFKTPQVSRSTADCSNTPGYFVRRSARRGGRTN